MTMPDNNDDDVAPLRILSLGAGVQSTALLVMAAEGLIDVDAAVFADTQWEPRKVYDHLWSVAERDEFRRARIEAREF